MLLAIEKILAFHNVIILIESVVYKNKNHYYNVFLEKKIRIKINPIHNNFEWMFCMLYLERIGVSDGIHASKECDIC